MKKIFAMALAACMVVSLAACGSSSSTTAAASTAKEATSAAAEASAVSEAVEAVAAAGDSKVAVLWYTFSDAYLSTVREALDADLTAAGVNFSDYDSNNNQGTQLEQVQTAVADGCTLLVVNLVTSGSADAAKQIIEAAAGVPVVFFNRAVEGDGEEGTVLGENDNIIFIGTDAPEAGHMQGKMIGDYLVANYDAIDLNGDGVISYAMFMGDAANVEAIYRTQYGVEDANAVLTAAGKPELEYFNASNTDKYQLDPNGAWSSAAANEFMGTNLAEYSEANNNMIELVIANNDDMAIGSISALQAAGYNLESGDCKVIPVFGVDATQVAQDAIAAGTMTGTVKQDAEGMAAAIAAAVADISAGTAVADAAATVADSADIYSMADGFTNKIFVAYAPYTK